MPSHFGLQHPAGFTVSRELTESLLLTALPEAATSKSDMGTGWVWYRLPPFLDAEVFVAISLGFNNGNLELLTLTDGNAKYGSTWNEWPEENEIRRASSIGSWLSHRGISIGSHPWGSVSVGYDAKAGFGSATVRLAA